MSSLAPVLYLPHGGGPLPLLADPAHQELVAGLRKLPQIIPKPAAIVVVSAHWEAGQPTLNANAHPGLLFDYYGFPPQAYEFSYPVTGDPELCHEIQSMFASHGIQSDLEYQRGLDHGVFVPLMLMYPDADIPVVQLSLIQGLQAQAHVALGQALSALRERNILILGSGMSFHNLQAFFASDAQQSNQASKRFAQWLDSALIDHKLTSGERLARLTEWQQAPFADYCHPRAEHLIPLHICLGAAQGSTANKIIDVALMGKEVAGYMWK